MRLNFGKLFQHFSKDRSMDGQVKIPQDSALWPESWKKTEFKKFDSHFPLVSLPAAALTLPYDETVLSRRSVREWRDVPLSLQQVSNLLNYSCGTSRKVLDPTASHRVQASAGRRYPLEVYLVNQKQGELGRNVYHYSPEKHALHTLWPLELFEEAHLNSLSGYEWSKNAAGLIVITAVVDRSVRKYGERGYRYMYLEAGAIANTLNVIGSTAGMGSVILGGINDTEVEEILDIDGEYETVLIGVCVGNRA